VTEHPLVPGSSVKGVLRDATPREWQVPVFGPDTAHAHEHAGALRISDAQLLLMPVSSDLGTFAWVTCPWALAQLQRRALLATALPLKVPEKMPPLPGKSGLLTAPQSMLVDQEKATIGGLALGKAGELAKEWVDFLAGLLFDQGSWWEGALKGRLALVHDDVFTAFARHSTDVRAHIRIDDHTGTVERGALWYEESLPMETVLVGLLQAAPSGKTGKKAGEVMKVVRDLSRQRLQFGGKASTGMGDARFLVWGGGQ
jgi:CRISPR-associated protein Cmr4